MLRGQRKGRRNRFGDRGGVINSDSKGKEGKERGGSRRGGGTKALNHSGEKRKRGLGSLKE